MRLTRRNWQTELVKADKFKICNVSRQAGGEPGELGLQFQSQSNPRGELAHSGEASLFSGLQLFG